MLFDHFQPIGKALSSVHLLVLFACGCMCSAPVCTCVLFILTHAAGSSSLSILPTTLHVSAGGANMATTETCGDTFAGFDSPCVQRVSATGDVEVDCSGSGISEIPAAWFPCDVRKLSLDRNDLVVLTNSSFIGLSQLRWLSVTYNKIRRIEPGTFDSLIELEYLNLAYNKLSLSSSSYPPGLFKPFKRLKILRLAPQEGTAGEYPHDFVFNISSLEALSIPSTNYSELRLGSEFCQLNNLSRLEIGGLVLHITNSSFEKLQCLNLVELSFLYMQDISIFEVGSLYPVSKNLRSLHINTVYIGLQKALKLLWPFKGRNMYEISFRGVLETKVDHAIAIATGHGTLDGQSVMFLKDICLERLLLRDVNLFAIHPSAFPSHSLLWRCLKYVDASNNRLQGTLVAMFRLLNFPCIETIVLMKPDFDGPGPETDIERRIRVINTPLESMIPHQNDSHCDHANTVMKDIHTALRRQTPDPSTVYISKTLKEIIFHFTYASTSLSYDLRLGGAHSLETLVCRKCGLYHLTGELSGVNRIKELDLSLNDFSITSPRFTKHFTAVETLILSNVHPNSVFMSRESDQVFQTMTNLSTLDLSCNSLVALSSGTFRQNGWLKYIVLRDNKFRDIPFDISLTPRLQYLDLRKNAIVLLSDKQRQQLDMHVSNVEHFKLVLSENFLSCGCNAIPLLRWLTSTKVTLDNHGNYSCVTIQGRLSDTFSHREARALWRACYGGLYFWFSLALLACMSTGFFAVALVSRHGNYIRAAIFRVFYANFRMKTRDDYPIGVFIGYADRDYQFPCLRLLPYLENIDLVTYVRDRDSLPNQDTATAIMGAIQSSWRVILVVTQAFLEEDQWAEYTMRSAVFSQNPVDPARVILVVEERLEWRLPTSLLVAVADENIVCLPRLRMCYELRQRLRALLLHG